MNLKENLLPFSEELGGHFWMFQHDSVSKHTANSTSEYFLNNNVHLILWTSASPDLNRKGNNKVYWLQMFTQVHVESM